MSSQCFAARGAAFAGVRPRAGTRRALAGARGVQRGSRPARGAPTTRAEAAKIEVCVNKECKRAGSKKTLAMLQALAGTKEVEVVEVVCLDECEMGPNCRLGGDDGPVVNGVKTQEDVDKLVAKAEEQ